MDFDKMRQLLTSTYGKPRWSGCDSNVWRVGDYVIKLCHVPDVQWKAMRILSRRQGPYAPILDMRVVGYDSSYMHTAYITGIIVQPYIRMSRQLGRDEWPHDQDFTTIPYEWFDGIDCWRQPDWGSSNAVNGVWVDLARIERGLPKLDTNNLRRIDKEKKLGLQPIEA